jgi:hypothetical protein
MKALATFIVLGSLAALLASPLLANGGTVRVSRAVRTASS